MVVSEHRPAGRLGESSRALQTEGFVDVGALLVLDSFFRSLAVVAVGIFDSY